MRRTVLEYVEGYDRQRPMLEKARLARQGWAGEIKAFFNIPLLADIPADAESFVEELVMIVSVLDYYADNHEHHPTDGRHAPEIRTRLLEIGENRSTPSAVKNNGPNPSE